MEKIDSCDKLRLRLDCEISDMADGRTLIQHKVELIPFFLLSLIVACLSVSVFFYR